MAAKCPTFGGSSYIEGDMDFFGRHCFENVMGVKDITKDAMNTYRRKVKYGPPPFGNQGRRKCDTLLP